MTLHAFGAPAGGLLALGLLLAVADPSRSQQDSGSPRVTAAWVERPFAAGRNGSLRMKVEAPGREPVALELDHGDGLRTVAGRGCRGDAGPSGRATFAGLIHRYARTGTFTVTGRAVAAESCSSGLDGAEQGPPFTIDVRVFPARVKVPSVTGRPPLRAKCRLERSGLRWNYRGFSGPAPFNDACSALRGEPIPGESHNVTYQKPGAGRRARPGTIVTLETCAAKGCI